MAQPKPKLLPTVKYNPPPQVLGYNPGNYYNPSQQDQPPTNYVSPGQYAQPLPTDPNAGISGSVTVMPPPSATPTVPDILGGADKRGMQGGAQGGQNYGLPQSNVTETHAPPQSALTNNRNNLANAQASGDTANIQRLQAEWERIAPLAQQHGITADRLVNSYMQPDNPAAKSDFGGALAAAIADDVWGNEATSAFGRPPNQLEWQQHWEAMNKGGRDPLEGHPQAVQNIQAAMQNMGTANQTAVNSDLQQWLAGQK